MKIFYVHDLATYSATKALSRQDDPDGERLAAAEVLVKHWNSTLRRALRRMILDSGGFTLPDPEVNDDVPSHALMVDKVDGFNPDYSLGYYRQFEPVITSSNGYIITVPIKGDGYYRFSDGCTEEIYHVEGNKISRINVFQEIETLINQEKQ